MNKFIAVFGLTCCFFLISGISPTVTSPSLEPNLAEAEEVPETTDKEGVSKGKPKKRDCIKNIDRQQRDIVDGLRDISDMLKKKDVKSPQPLVTKPRQ